MQTSNAFSISIALSAVFSTGCRSDLPSNIKRLAVTADLPPGLEVEVHREFESVPFSFLCRTFTEDTGYFVPMQDDVIDSLRASEGRIDVPLAYEQRSICPWRYLNASVRLVDGAMDVFALRFAGTDLVYGELENQRIAMGCESTVSAECLRCHDAGDDVVAVQCRVRFEADNSSCETNPTPDILPIHIRATFLQSESAPWSECRKLVADNENLLRAAQNAAPTGEEKMADGKDLEVSGMDLDAGLTIDLKPGDRLRLNVSEDRPDTVRLRLSVSADNPAPEDDKFRLFASDGSYDKTLEVKDDLVENDGFLDLLFEDVDKTRTYSLEVAPGGGAAKYLVFENRKFE